MGQQPQSTTMCTAETCTDRCTQEDKQAKNEQINNLIHIGPVNVLYLIIFRDGYIYFRLHVVNKTAHFASPLKI